MISGIVLAAGTSSRMGETKQLLALRGVPLLQHALDAAAEAPLDEIIVVLGHDADEIRVALSLPDTARIALNPDYASGQASSLRTGLSAADPRSRAAVILLGDQPDMPTDVIRAVIHTYERTGGPVVRARYGKHPGHPVLLDRSVWRQVATEASGDRGAGPVLERHSDWVIWAPIDGPPPAEVDTPGDFDLLLG